MVLIGQNLVRRWVRAEVQVALVRHWSPHDDQQRLPICPILLGDAEPDLMPPFLALFRATNTPVIRTPPWQRFGGLIALSKRPGR